MCFKFLLDCFLEETHGSEGDGEIPELPRKEVIRRLRERGEPILLFGETYSEAFQRLRELEILRPEIVKVGYLAKAIDFLR